MKKKFIIYIIVASGLVGSVFGAIVYSIRNKFLDGVVVDRSKSGAMGSNASQESDLSIPENLVGFHHEVFVGKVIQQAGTEKYPSSGHPSAQFKVQIIHNIKGALRGSLALAQLRGIEPLVQVGSTYIFAARFSNVTGWYTFGIQESFRLLSDDVNLNDAELKTLAENNARVLELQKAYPSENIPGHDSVGHAAYNSYVSRRYDANGELIDDTIELAKSNGFIPAESTTTIPSESTAPPEEL